MMRALILLPVLAGLLLFAGCKKKTPPPEAEAGGSADPSVAELQRQLEEALKK